jgi:hypothetical protein
LPSPLKSAFAGGMSAPLLGAPLVLLPSPSKRTNSCVGALLPLLRPRRCRRVAQRDLNGGLRDLELDLDLDGELDVSICLRWTRLRSARLQRRSLAQVLSVNVALARALRRVIAD